jgi:hypothetical protein
VAKGRGWTHRLGTPAFTDALLAVLVVSCSLASLAYHDIVGPRSAADGVGRLLTLYASVASDLPADARIGFVSSIADRTRSAATMNLAQNALVPRLLDPTLAAVSFVISTPSAPESLDDDPRLTGFELIRSTPEGIRIYQRRR